MRSHEPRTAVVILPLDQSTEGRAGPALRCVPAPSELERYMPPGGGATGTSAPDRGGRPIVLMRGRDVSGRSTLVTETTRQDVRDGASASALP